LDAQVYIARLLVYDNTPAGANITGVVSRLSSWWSIWEPPGAQRGSPPKKGGCSKGETPLWGPLPREPKGGKRESLKSLGGKRTYPRINLRETPLGGEKTPKRGFKKLKDKRGFKKPARTSEELMGGNLEGLLRITNPVHFGSKGLPNALLGICNAKKSIVQIYKTPDTVD